MDLSYTDEQKLLRDSVARFVKQDYTFDDRKKIVETGKGYSPENWATFAELGWLMIPFSEDDGGIGGGEVETMIIMEELGRGLVIEPYLPTVVMAGGLLARHGTQAQKDAYLPKIMEGGLIASVAFAEGRGRYNLNTCSASARADGEGYVLNGDKAVVLHGPNAGLFIVSARTGGNTSDLDGISLFLVPADAEGLTRRDYPTLDGQVACELSLENVKVGADALLGEAGQGFGMLEEMSDHALLAIGAETVGALSVVLATTTEYCKTRKQFDVPLSKFQVVQHALVDIFTQVEQAKSALIMAVLKIPQGEDERRKAASALKAKLDQCAKFVGQTAVQLHGGMGVTDEMAVAHYFKRLTVVEHLFGNRDFHLRRFARLTQKKAA